MVNPDTPSLVLASGSRYRATLLQRLQLPFEICAPDTDETPHAAETVAAMTRRLARDKAAALRDRFPQAWISPPPAATASSASPEPWSVPGSNCIPCPGRPWTS